MILSADSEILCEKKLNLKFKHPSDNTQIYIFVCISACFINLNSLVINEEPCFLPNAQSMKHVIYSRRFEVRCLSAH